MGSLNLLIDLEPASLLLREGCEAFLPSSLSDTLLECATNHEEEFPLPAGCCSMLFGLPWVVLLTGIIEAFTLELFLHFLVSGDSFGKNPVLPCFHYLGKAAGMACSLSLVCLHPELLILPWFLKSPETHCKMGWVTGMFCTFLCFTADVGGSRCGFLTL